MRTSSTMSRQAADTTQRDNQAVAEKVLAIVRTKAYSPVSLDSTFDSLGLDSLAMAEMVFEIEKTFDFRADDGLLDVRDLRQVVEYVVMKIDSTQRRST